MQHFKHLKEEESDDNDLKNIKSHNKSSEKIES